MTSAWLSIVHVCLVGLALLTLLIVRLLAVLLLTVCTVLQYDKYDNTVAWCQVMCNIWSCVPV